MKSGVGLNFVRNTDISVLDRMLPSIQKDWESPESYEEVVSYFIDFVSIVILKSSIFSSLLWRRLLHLQEHGGGSEGCNRKLPKPYEAGGLEATSRNALLKLLGYHRRYNRDNPSDIP